MLSKHVIVRTRGLSSQAIERFCELFPHLRLTEHQPDTVGLVVYRSGGSMWLGPSEFARLDRLSEDYGVTRLPLSTFMRAVGHPLTQS